MTPTQYRAIRKSLGLTQAELGRVLGLELRAVQYHEAADGRIPPPVERLMWLMQMHPPLVHRLRRPDGNHTVVCPSDTGTGNAT